jgi:hypothetical protein
MAHRYHARKRRTDDTAKTEIEKNVGNGLT